jgi:hypothetical protein
MWSSTGEPTPGGALRMRGMAACGSVSRSGEVKVTPLSVPAPQGAKPSTADRRADHENQTLMALQDRVRATLDSLFRWQIFRRLRARRFLRRTHDVLPQTRAAHVRDDTEFSRLHANLVA